MQHDEHCDSLEIILASLALSLEGADLGVVVPTCPRWDVLKLLSHLGGIHRWCGAMVAAVAQERIDQRSSKPERDAMVSWFNEGGRSLVATLRAADPDAAMYAWGADQHVRFWSRRQLHEAAIHQFDICNAYGIPFDMPSAVAADGVDEFLDNVASAGYFAPNVAELRGNGESIHLHATDAEGEWLIHLGPQGFTYEHGHGKGTVAVRGPIADLALLMWGRRHLEDPCFESFGDVGLMQHWIANSAL